MTLPHCLQRTPVRSARSQSSLGVKGRRPMSMRLPSRPRRAGTRVLVSRTLMPATRKPAMPMERISLMGTVRRARKPMATVDAEMRSVRPAWRAAMTEAYRSGVARGDGFAEAADHEEGVVDAEAEAKHGGEILDEDGEVESLGEQGGDGQGGRDGELADGQGNDRGDEAAEGEQQEGEGGGNDQAFAAVDVVGAGFADVEVQRKLAGELELDGGVAATQLVGERGCLLVKLGDQRLDGAIGGGEADENEGSASAAEEDGIARVEIGDDSGDAGLLLELRRRWCRAPAGHRASPRGEALARRGRRGRRRANESEWRAPAERLRLRCLRRGLPSPDDARRGRRRAEEQ